MEKTAIVLAYLMWRLRYVLSGLLVLWITYRIYLWQIQERVNNRIGGEIFIPFYVLIIWLLMRKEKI